MKRFLTALLAVLLLLVCSCATRTVYVSQNEPSDTQVSEDTEGKTESCTNTDDITKEPQSDTAQVTDEATADISISDGVTDGQTYKNTSLGIGCTLSEDWRFMTSEELYERNGSLFGDILPLQTDDGQMSDGTDTVKDENEKPSHSYIMCSVYSDGLSDLTLSIEYIGAGADLVDVSQLLLTSAETMKPSFESLGYTDFQYEADTVNIGGRIFHAIRIFSRNDKISIDQLMFCFIKNEHLVSVCISDYGADIIDQTKKCFFLTEE